MKARDEVQVQASEAAVEELPAESMGEVFRIMHMDAREGSEQRQRDRY